MIENVGWLASFGKPPDWVGWLAVAISAGTIFVAVRKFGQHVVFWVDWFLVKPLVFRLRKEKVAFRIMIARIAGDEKTGRNRTLAQRIRKVSNNLIAVPYPFQLDLKLVGRDFSSELERADRIGRRWLARYKADLLMWGYSHADVDPADADMHPIILRFVPANAPTKEREFRLKELVEGEFCAATAEALHLEALSALDPIGPLRRATKDEPQSSPAEERRELLLQAADKSARLLEDPRGLTGQQRAELAVALAEAWFTIVDETGDVRLLPRAVSYLERALADTAAVASAKIARLHLLLARALIGGHPVLGIVTKPRVAQHAIEIIDAGMRLLDRSSNRPDASEWRYWRAESLRLFGRYDEAIIECDTALKSVALADDPELWGRLVSLMGVSVGQREQWRVGALDRFAERMTEAIASLDAIEMNKAESQGGSVVRRRLRVAAARLGHWRLWSMRERAIRSDDSTMLEEAIAEADLLLARFSERRWKILATKIRSEVVFFNLILAKILAKSLLHSDVEDAAEQRSRARDRWRRARELAAALRKATDALANPHDWISATMSEAEAASEMGVIDSDPISLAWALKGFDEALVVAKRVGDRESEALIGSRMLTALLGMHQLEHTRTGRQGRDDALLLEALERADALQAAASRSHSPRIWAIVEFKRAQVYLRRAEFATDLFVEFAAARSAFAAAAAAFAEVEDPANERICQWYLKKAEHDEQLFRAAEASPPLGLPGR